MPLLGVLIVQNSYILAELYFVSLKKIPRPDLKGFLFQKWESSNQVRHILVL